MRLRSKLTALIALASVVPTVAATWVGRGLVQREFRAEFAQLLRDGRMEVQTQYRVLQEEVARAVERLADPDDQFIGPILIDLAKGGLEDETVRRLAIIAPRVMQERGLDVLSVIEASGRILASGHFPGRIGDTEPEGLRLPERSPGLLRARVLSQHKPETRLAVAVRRRVHSPLGRSAIVIGGRALAPELVRRVRLRGGTVLLIADAKGARLAGPSDADWRRYVSYPHEVVALGDAARATLAVPDDGLRHTLQAINLTAGALVASGLLLALILGLAAARRVSRPLQELASGAVAVAQGDLDRRLEVRSRDEVGELVQAFNRMTSELKESKEQLVAAERVAAWQEIARRIAHEIKNPLFPIQTSIETLRKTYAKQHPAFAEIFEESTTTILEEVARLKTIATEFSQFARLPKAQLAPCRIEEVLNAVVTLYGAGGIPLHCVLPEGLPLVQGDKEQLIQVFSNLVKNAKEAVSERSDPRIEIRAAVCEGSMEVTVADNGPGFSAEVEAKIFTPYFTTKGTSGGSGLGLAIVQRIVMDHGGAIEAHSGEAGAWFLVRLPLA